MRIYAGRNYYYMKEKLRAWMEAHRDLKPKDMKDPKVQKEFQEKLAANAAAVEKIIKKSQVSFERFYLPFATM